MSSSTALIKTAPQPTVINATPLEMKATLTYRDAAGSTVLQIGGIQLAPLQTMPFDISKVQSSSEVETIGVSLQSMIGLSLGEFQIHRTDPSLVITYERLQLTDLKKFCDALRSAPSFRWEWRENQWLWVLNGVGRGPFVRFFNDTDLSVDIYYKDSEKVGSLVSLPPRGFHENNYLHPMWIVKAAFTGELLALSPIYKGDIQDIHISMDFCEKVREKKTEQWLPSPVPEIPTLYLVGQEPSTDADKEVKVDPASRDYVVISEFENLSRPQFNTRQNVPTRSVRMSGVEISSEDDFSLGSYRGQSGEAVLDLASLEIYADRVIIASTLRFPGTEVTIYARELEFKPGGRIDTTPVEFKVPAMTPPAQRDNEGRPKFYAGANGDPGETGGNINVFVKKIVVPPNERAAVRFVSRGSQGQDAEKGGHKPYQQGSPTQSKTAKTIGSALPEWIAGVLGTSLEAWRWPGELRDPKDIQWDGKKLFETIETSEGQDGLFTVTKNSLVTALRIDAHDDRIPSFRSGHLSKEIYWPPKDSNIPTCPGNGEDAYPGGLPGNGGPGGDVRTCLSTDSLLPLCDLTPGAPGLETPAVKGKEKGKPDPAYSVDMTIVYYDSWIASSRKPSIKVTPLQFRDGNDAPARQGKTGKQGSVAYESKNWMHTDVVDAVLGCARDAYRKEDRELAYKLLEPYYGELRNTQDAELKGRLAIIEALRGKLLRNVDYYGNPPGWVPRLNLQSTFEIFKNVQSISSSLLYYALNMEDKYETLQNANDLARETSDAVRREMEYSTASLKRACTDLAKARLELDKVRDEVNKMDGDIQMLKAWTTQEAQDKVHAQRVFRGVMKTVGGLMKVVPVGQPYLGLAGDITGGIGDFNWNDPGGITNQIAGSLTQIGASTDKFLKDNKDLIVKDLVPSELRKSLQLDQQVAADLDYELAKDKADMDAQELEVKRAQDVKSREWQTNNSPELETLKKQLGDTLEEFRQGMSLASLTPDDLKKKQEELSRLKMWSEGQDASILQLRRQLLEKRIKTIEEEKVQAQNLQNDSLLKLLDKEKTKLTGLKRAYTNKELEAKKYARDIKLTSGKIKNKEEQIGTAVDRLKGIGTGISMLGQGIASFATVTKDDPEVKSLTAALLNSEKKEEFTKLLDGFSKLSQQQSAAMGKLLSAQARVDSYVANITQNLVELNALSHQRQSLESVLDIRVKRYMKDMKSRAIDTLRWSIYTLVMAYRYEHLKDVSKDFFNFDQVVERLRKVDTASAETDFDRRYWKVGQERFKAPEEITLKNEFLAMARPILESRQTVATLGRGNSWKCKLSAEQCGELRLKGRVTFNLVRDLKNGSFKDTVARITDISDLKLPIATAESKLNLKAVFWHSGESIIRSANPPHLPYFFRAGRDDDPIFWGFNCEYTSRGAVTSAQAKKDTLLGDNDKFLQGLLATTVKPEPGETGKPPQITYREYFPSYFSDITLVLTRGNDPWDPNLLSKVKDVEFIVNYSFGSTGH